MGGKGRGKGKKGEGRKGRREGLEAGGG